MISFKTIGRIGAAAFLYFGILRGATALYFGIKDYFFRSISLTNQMAEFVVTFTIHNPLFVGLTLKSVAGDIYIQGIKCGTINQSYDYFLPGRKTWNISIPVQIDLKQLTSAVIQNISTGDINTLTIAFDGYAFIGGSGLVRIPFQKTITWDDLQK